MPLQQTGDSHQQLRIVRVRPPRALVLLAGAPVVPLILVVAAKRPVSFGEIGLQRQRPLRRRERPLQAPRVRIVAVLPHLGVCLGERCPRQREVRVELHRVLVHLRGGERCPLQKAELGAVQVVVAAQVVVVRLQVIRRLITDSGRLVHRERRVERLGHSQRDLALDGQQVVDAQLAVVGLGPQVLVALGIDQLQVDPHCLAGPLNAALEYVAGVQLPADLSQILRAVAIRHDRGAASDAEAADLRQPTEDLVVDPVGEVLVLL